MKILTCVLNETSRRRQLLISSQKEEEKAHYNETVKGGTIGGLAGLAVGALGVYAAGARYPAFRQLTLPLQAFLVTSSGTFAGRLCTRPKDLRQANTSQPSYQQTHGRDPTNARGILSSNTKMRTKLWKSRSRRRRLRRRGRWTGCLTTDTASSSVHGSHRWAQHSALSDGIHTLRDNRSLCTLVCTRRALRSPLSLRHLRLRRATQREGEGRWETVKIIDPNDPEHKNVIEKKIHHEAYAGEDQWKDMIAAEEDRLKEREKAVNKSKKDHKGNGKKVDKKEKKEAKEDDEIHGKPEEAVSEKLNAP